MDQYKYKEMDTRIAKRRRERYRGPLRACYVVVPVVCILVFLLGMMWLTINHMASTQERRHDSLVRSEFESLLHQMELTQTYLKLVNTTIEHLDNKINQPVRIFEMCESQNETCVVGSRGNGAFWKACRTNFLPVEVTVSAIKTASESNNWRTEFHFVSSVLYIGLHYY